MLRRKGQRIEGRKTRDNGKEKKRDYWISLRKKNKPRKDKLRVQPQVYRGQNKTLCITGQLVTSIRN